MRNTFLELLPHSDSALGQEVLPLPMLLLQLIERALLLLLLHSNQLQLQSPSLRQSQMRGSSISQYSPHRPSRSPQGFRLFRKQEKGRDCGLPGFNDRIIKARSACFYSLERKSGPAQSLQQRPQYQTQNLRKSYNLSKLQLKVQASPKTEISQIIKTQQAAYKAPQYKIFQSQMLCFSNNQVFKWNHSKDSYYRVLKSTFFPKKPTSHTLNSNSTLTLPKNQRERALSNLEPWIATHQLMNETLNFKTQSQSNSRKKIKASKVKRLKHKNV